MPQENHLTEVRFQNFKRFTDLAISDLGQFNLIVGDNNVGKTSVLEGLIPEIKSDDHANFPDFARDFIYSLEYVLYFYKKNTLLKQPPLELYFNKSANKKFFQIAYTTKIDKPSIKVEKNDKGYDFSWSSGINKFQIDGWSLKGNPAVEAPRFHNPFFIPYFLGYRHDLTDYYSQHIQDNRALRESFLKSLRIIVEDIDSIIVNTVDNVIPILKISRKSQTESLALSTYGEGFTNLFRLLIEIYKNEGRRMMFDEIDYGVHFSRKTKFWEATLAAAFANNVQLFATTHNDECINSLKEAADQLSQNKDTQAIADEIKIIRMVENKDKSISAYTYDYKEFSHSIEHENELR